MLAVQSYRASGSGTATRSSSAGNWVTGQRVVFNLSKASDVAEVKVGSNSITFAYAGKYVVSGSLNVGWIQNDLRFSLRFEESSSTSNYTQLTSGSMSGGFDGTFSKEVNIKQDGDVMRFAIVATNSYSMAVSFYADIDFSIAATM